jgi:beta-mannosidase
MFEKKTGRFVSEYGMMAMPNMNTTASVTLPQDRYLYSEALKTHQKHPTGFQNMNGYLHQYFMDSARIKHLSLEQYTYLTQCLQYYAFKNSIAIHRSKYPVNMGTLLWQLNDCWPVASWAITDFSRQPKAAWYAVKEAYRDDVLPQRDAVRPKALQLSKPNFTLQWKNAETLLIQSHVPAKYVYLHVPGVNLQLSDNYFDLQPGDTKAISIKGLPVSQRKSLRIWSLYDVVHQ